MIVVLKYLNGCLKEHGRTLFSLAAEGRTHGERNCSKANLGQSSGKNVLTEKSIRQWNELPKGSR